jgi:methylated-DNA-[protein]-cysteine S-methyltransferase
MTDAAFALFDSPIGRCGIVWSERGIAGVQLPEASEAATRARITKRFPGARESAATRAVQRAIDGVGSLLRRESSALDAIELDFSRVPPFHRRVYEAARSIAPGETLTYGGIAARLGEPDKARAVGQALARNPFAIVVPCHRVLAANGKLGGFSANGGAATKLRLLSLEGAHAAEQTSLFEGDGRLGFDSTPSKRWPGCAPPTLHWRV